MQGRSWALDALAECLFAAAHPHKSPSAPAHGNGAAAAQPAAAGAATSRPAEAHSSPTLLPMAPPSSSCRLGPFRPLPRPSDSKPTMPLAPNSSTTGMAPPSNQPPDPARSAEAGMGAGAARVPMAPPSFPKPGQAAVGALAAGTPQGGEGHSGGSAANGKPLPPAGDAGPQVAGVATQKQPEQQQNGGKAHSVRALSQRRKKWYERKKARMLSSTLEMPCDPDIAAALDAAQLLQEQDRQQPNGPPQQPQQPQQLQQQQQQQQQEQPQQQSEGRPLDAGTVGAPNSGGALQAPAPASSSSGHGSPLGAHMVVCACCCRPCRISCVAPGELQGLHKAGNAAEGGTARAKQQAAPQEAVAPGDSIINGGCEGASQPVGSWYCGPECKRVAAAVAELCARGRLPAAPKGPAASAAVGAVAGAEAAGCEEGQGHEEDVHQSLAASWQLLPLAWAASPPQASEAAASEPQAGEADGRELASAIAQVRGVRTRGEGCVCTGALF